MIGWCFTPTLAEYQLYCGTKLKINLYLIRNIFVQNSYAKIGYAYFSLYLVISTYTVHAALS